MDLHLVTLALGEANFSCYNRGVISSGEPANVRLGNCSDDAGPARLSDIATVLADEAAGAARQRASPLSRVDGAPDCATPCRQEVLA
jgi:hypothetical protein